MVLASVEGGVLGRIAGSVSSFGGGAAGFTSGVRLSVSSTPPGVMGWAATVPVRKASESNSHPDE